LGRVVWYYRKCGDEISWKGDFVTFFVITIREVMRDVDYKMLDNL